MHYGIISWSLPIYSQVRLPFIFQLTVQILLHKKTTRNTAAYG